jgi:hypothetical protein
MRAAFLAASIALSGVANAATDVELPITKFSSAELGEALPQGWEKVELPYGKKSEFHIVPAGKWHALQVRAEGSFGSAAFRLSAEAADTPILKWRWKIDRVVDAANMESKEEDFAARLYVSFDFPEDELSKGERVKLGIANKVMGFVPGAAICYVWDNKHPIGKQVWSPYFGHVRVIVLESGGDNVDKWMEETRDVEADFVAAYGEKWKGRVPKITGVVAGNDTDQTGEAATVWFGDIHLGPRP